MPTPTFPVQPAKPTISPADAIAAIGRGNPKAFELAALSDLNRSDARELASIWPAIREELRVAIVRQLDELAENNVQYLFGRVYRIALADDSPVVRQLAVASLWEDEGSDLIDRFIGMMEDDPSIDVRSAAAMGLARFADLAATGDLDDVAGERVRRALLEQATAGDQTSHVRRRALESVAVLGNPTEIESLIRVSYESDDADERASSLYAMGRTGDRRWLPIVLDEFESSDDELRYEAARAAGEFGHVDALPGLADLIHDRDVEVRQAAIVALGKIGGPGAIRILRAYAGAASAADREAVEEAISEAELMLEARGGRQ